MKKKAFMAVPLLSLLGATAEAQSLKLNDLEYFEQTGVNVLVYSNMYQGIFCDEKEAGIEIVQRGERIATGGGIRLMNTPEQWDIYAEMKSRQVVGNGIEVKLAYADYDLAHTITVTPKDKGVSIAVSLDKPVPKELEGKAGFNLEFFPASFFGKTYLVDGQSEILPRHPAGDTYMRPVNEKIPQFYGLTTFDDRGLNEFIVPKPMSTGHTLVLAPEDDNLRVLIKSDTEINLFDGRNLSQNGTFVVRSFLPADKSGKVLEWYLEPYSDPKWIRKPNIGFSQIGYTPAQKKVSVVELDKNDQVAATAKIWRYEADGSRTLALEPKVKEWGKFNHRYNYAQIDFSDVKEPGSYCIEYKGVITNAFPINKTVYDGKWHTTMDVWLPVQMDHMEVNEAYRIWHGRSNMDDALQAPTNYEQHDGYRQGAETFTKYKPWEHIPGLSVGAWYDAGDFDIQAGTVVGMTSDLATLWEMCRPERDETFIDQTTQFVDIHRPDGVPDVIQQIEHGALNIIAQVENIGFVAQGIVQVNMHQYHHVGDGVTQTDGKVYNSDLKMFEVKGDYSGTRDDRVAFTGNFSPMGTMSSVAALAAAARTLKPYKPETADHCLRTALYLWDKYSSEENFQNSNRRGGWGGFGTMGGDPRTNAAVELWRTTGEKKYKDFFMPKLLETLKPMEMNPNQRSWAYMMEGASKNGKYINLSMALSLYDYMDKDFQKKVRDALPIYLETLDYVHNNPYQVPISGRGWGGNEMVVFNALNYYRVWRLFPDKIDPERILNGLNYLYGCHPISNVSFVMAVGVNTKKVSYGNNRADYTFIPGGIAPGLMMFAPDLLEHKDDYPFLWGENECCTRQVPSYVMLSIACEQVAKMMNK